MDRLAIDPIGASGARYAETAVEVEPGVRLRVMTWTPDVATDDVPVVFVAGWVSSVLGWAEMIRELAARRPVIYIETREKSSAHIAKSGLGPADFSIEQMARDLVAAFDALDIKPARAVVAASSLGATAVLEALKHGRLRARAAFLIGPNAEFRAPRSLRPILYLPAGLYHVVKYFVLWYVRTFRVDVKREPEQWGRYNRTLRDANPLRLKMSARAVMDYTVWDALETVEVPVAVAYAPSDKLHGADNIHRIVETMTNARAVECVSNKAMHDERVARRIEDFIAKLEALSGRRRAV
ncbi:MAG: alpha/beta hydrolase [Deltaproteobacteria bacterium]|nr:alpha/beta hydrolase [Deltaproteobacteria bacterium]